MNGLVYVMYNLKLKNKLIRKIDALLFDDILSDDELITTKGYNVVEIEQVQCDDERGNANLDRATRDPILDALDLDNRTFDANIDTQFSCEKEFDGDDILMKMMMSLEDWTLKFDIR